MLNKIWKNIYGYITYITNKDNVILTGIRFCIYGISIMDFYNGKMLIGCLILTPQIVSALLNIYIYSLRNTNFLIYRNITKKEIRNLMKEERKELNIDDEIEHQEHFIKATEIILEAAKEELKELKNKKGKIN